jgi:predicted permease
MSAPRGRRSLAMSIIEVFTGTWQWLNRRQFERDMDDEMRFHIDMEARDLTSHGMTVQEARVHALRTFGGQTRFKEEARVALPLFWLSDIRTDLRYALRSLRRTPAFTGVAILALGIGIAANATLFGLADAAAFRPLDAREPDRLYSVFGRQSDGSPLNLSYPTYLDLKGGVPAFADVAAFTERTVSLNGDGTPVAAWAAHITDNYFTLVGVRATVGRLTQPGEQTTPVAVLSHAFWQTQFGGDRRVIGKSIRVNGAPFTVIGVAPSGFHGMRLFTFAPSLWLPIGMHAQTLPGTGDLLHDRARARFNVIGRVADGTRVGIAREQVRTVASQLARDYPSAPEGSRLDLLSNRTPINPWLAAPERLAMIGFLSLAGGWLVLLIACADVANLLLARMTARGREIATRLALGASRGRLVRQFLAESALLAALGAAAALPLAALALKGSQRLTPPLDFAPAFSPSLDGRSLTFTALVAVATALVFGLLPLVHAWSPDLAGMFRGAANNPKAGANRSRQTLVVAQVATSVVVLAMAGLFTRSLGAARRIDVGFDTRHTLAFSIDPSLLVGYNPARVATLYQRITADLEGLAGVQSIARASSIPLDGNSSSLRVLASEATATSRAIVADNFVVSPNYFATLGMSIVAGRAFSRADTAGVERILVNETLARRLWPDSPGAVGQQIWLDSVGGARVEVLGVVRSHASRQLGDAPRALIWRSLERNRLPRTTVIVRVSDRPDRLIPVVRRRMQAMAPDLPVVGLRPLDQYIALAYSAAQGGAAGASALGVVASLLAAAGIFGVVAYTVSQRTREMGIRVALGARTSQLVVLMVRSGLGPTALGILTGLGLTMAIPRGMSAILYGISPHDPAVLVGASAFFLLVATVAALIPAWRGARVDPRRALQVD